MCQCYYLVSEKNAFNIVLFFTQKPCRGLRITWILLQMFAIDLKKCVAVFGPVEFQGFLLRKIVNVKQNHSKEENYKKLVNSYFRLSTWSCSSIFDFHHGVCV